MPTHKKVCFYCRQEFEATHALANICSPECRKRSLQLGFGKHRPGPIETSGPRKQVEAKCAKPVEDQPPDRTVGEGVGCCVRCGKALPNPLGVRKYCSSTCRNAIRRKNRKAMIQRAYVEAVSIAVLRQRDADRCRICGNPVDFSNQAPHPFAATIDHVIALAKGGKHSYENTQLAHLRCNMEKGAD